MQPNSIVLVVLLFMLGAGAIVATVRLRVLALRLLGGALAMLLCTTAGMAVVNDYYGYYRSWSQLAADLTGSYVGFAATTPVGRTTSTIDRGRLRVVTFDGARSGIRRPGLVYLPPQYFQPTYDRTRFPVVELLHGTPGSPANWIVHLDIANTLDRLISDHLMGPVIVVMPATYTGSDEQECVNAPRALDDTYLTHDVRTDVLAHYRASRDPAQWGVAGYSSGGYCAANLALRHPGMFGAAGVMGGYFRPTDGPAAAALHYLPSAERANDPLQRADQLTAHSSPLPSFWISAGSGDPADYAAARAFAAAIQRVEQVGMYTEPHASHNYYAWLPAVPKMLTWFWTQLAPPDLRVRFPVAGPVQGSVIAAPGARATPTCHRPVPVFSLSGPTQSYVRCVRRG